MMLASAVSTVSELGARVGAAGGRLAGEWIAVQPGDYDPSSGHGPEWGKAAPAGLLIWLFLGAALFVIVKSMNRHIRRLPKNEDGTASTSLVASEHGWVERDGAKAAAAAKPAETSGEGSSGRGSPPQGGRSEAAEPGASADNAIDNATDNAIDNATDDAAGGEPRV